MKRKLPMAALVAIIIALLTAFGAIAATVAGNMLRDKLSAGGAEDAAEQVADVHAEQSDGGFSFTVEQCYWEGNELCVSFTASVPEDGREYLLGLEMPTLNGERLRGPGHYMNDELSGYLMLLGGERMTTINEIRRVTAYAREIKDADNALYLRATFMTPERPIKWVNGEQYQRLLGDGEYTDELPENGFFYIDADAPVPVLGLAELKPVQDYWESRQIESVKRQAENSNSEDNENPVDYQRLTADDLQAIGLMKIEKTFEATVDVDGARYDGPAYKGLTERALSFDGFSVEVSRFELTHLKCAMSLTVTPDEGIDIADVPTDFALYRRDGSTLLGDGRKWISFAWLNASDDGAASYNVRCECSGILAIGGEDTFLLTPMYYDATAQTYIPDMDNAAAVTPTVEQFKGITDDTAWATPMGNYYHKDRYCMDMKGAEQIAVTDAEAQGKKPCPVCIQ